MHFTNQIITVSALMISFTYIYGRFQRQLKFRSELIHQLIHGLLFSTMAVLGMMVPIELSQGVFIDARSIFVVFSAVFGGIGASLLTALSCSFFRFAIGGVGSVPGILLILLGIPVGLLFRFLYFGKKFRKKTLLYLLVGFINALIALLLTLVLPEWDFALAMFRKALIPVMLFYPSISYFAGVLITRELNQIELENKSEKSHERKSKALEVSNDGYYDWDLLTDELYFDSNYYTMAGYEPDDFPGEIEEWRKRIHPDDLDRTSAELQLLLDGKLKKYDVEYRFRKKNGSWMWIHSRGIIAAEDKEGNVIKILGTHSDITKTRSTQLELKLLNSAIEHAAEMVMITGIDGIIQYINPSFTRITGYTREDIQGKRNNLLNSGEHDENFYRDMWKILSRGVSWRGRLKNRKKNGNIFTEEIVISPVFGNGNKIVNYVSIGRDITKDISFEEQMQQSQKMQAIGQLAGGVAHDFNNMLTGIVTATMMLKKMNSADVKSMKYLSIIDEAVQRSAELTQSLLTFSRKQPQQLSIIPLHSSVNKTVKLLKSTLDKRIQISIDLYPGSSTIIGEAAQIENSLLNLCINASHAIKEEGLISIKTESVFFDYNYCAENIFYIKPGEYIHLSVEDNGCGIESENLQKIFEPFFTTKEKSKGTGLGLSAVYGMIKQHHGTISVESQPGKGTEFHLYFPLLEKEEATEVEELNDQTFEQGEGCILLVDDEILIQTLIKDMLSESGYKVLLAENGEVAVDIFKEKSHEIDLIILDIIMPKMDGYACLKSIRKIDPDIKVIVESGSSSLDKIKEMEKLGIQGILRKPSGEQEIMKVISRVLTRSPVQ